MLDDLKLIHERDKQDALGCAEKQWQQLLYRFEVDLLKRRPIKNITWSGFGHSVVAAQFMQTWLDLELPINISSDYEIPKFVDKSTLFIAANYDGDADEVIKSYQQAHTTGAQIIVITSGGRLAELAKADNCALLVLPQTKSCCSSTLFFVKAAAQILEKLVCHKELSSELEAATVNLREEMINWQPMAATKDNVAKQAALELIGRSVVINSGPKLKPIATHLKLSLNVWAKNIAWQSVLPAASHDDYIGWQGQPLEKLYAVVNVCSSLEHVGVQKQFAIADKLLSGKRPAAYLVEPVGDNLLNQLLWGIVFSDFVAIYLAILNNANTSPTEILEKFQTELNK